MTARAEILGTDDFRVNVETGVEDNRFESESMDLTDGKALGARTAEPGILGRPQKGEEFQVLDTGRDNALPEPVTTRRRVRASNALIQTASTPQLTAPSVEGAVEGEEHSGGGLFWAFVVGVGLVFVVLLLLLKGSGGNDGEGQKKRRVRVR